MRRALLSLVVVPLFLGLPTSARAEEDKPDSSTLLKVPLAEARPTGVEGEENMVTPAPSPTPTLLEEGDPPAEAEPVVPADDGITRPAFPLSRYEPLWQRSPFQLESVAPPVESAGLAQRFALTGIAEINGEPIAFVMERATQNRLMIKANSTEGGVSLVQVDVQQKYADSSATLRQGAEVGVVRFEAGAAMAPGMPQPGMQVPRPMPQVIPQPGMPPQAAAFPGVAPAAQIPGQPAPGMPQAPGVVPPMPGQGNPLNGQVQGGQGQMPPPRVIRRRALIPAAP
jgi:hypothetical protein